MLRAWQRGRTGFPLVDAGMRQLWATGWMQQVSGRLWMQASDCEIICTSPWKTC